MFDRMYVRMYICTVCKCCTCTYCTCYLYVLMMLSKDFKCTESSAVYPTLCGRSTDPTVRLCGRSTDPTVRLCNCLHRTASTLYAH